MKKLVWSLFFLLAAAGWPSAASAQTKERAAARAGIRAYNAGNYDLALRNLLEAAQGADKLTPAERAKLHTYLAFCKVAFDDRDEAKFHFKQALMFDPKLELDPATVAPKIREVFLQAQVEFRASGVGAGGGSTGNGSSAAASATKSEAQLRLERSRANGALWRSALAPGWGQFHTDRKVAGYVVVGANAAALGTAAFRTWAWSEAKRNADDVRASNTTQPDILKAEKDQESYRNISLGVAAGVWVVTALEAYAGARWYGPKPKPASRVRVQPVLGPDGGAIVLTGHF